MRGSHKFRISQCDIDGFCVQATALYPDVEFLVSKSTNDSFFVHFSGTRIQAIAFRCCIERDICTVDEAIYAHTR